MKYVTVQARRVLPLFDGYILVPWPGWRVVKTVRLLVKLVTGHLRYRSFVCKLCLAWVILTKSLKTATVLLKISLCAEINPDLSCTKGYIHRYTILAKSSIQNLLSTIRLRVLGGELSNYIFPRASAVGASSWRLTKTISLNHIIRATFIWECYGW